MTFQQRAAEAIRASGGRLTAQREILLDLLAAAGEDLNAERLYQLASQRDPNISLPTVYRTLRTLEEARLISAHYVSSEHERKVYRAGGEEDTFHFTCRRCNRVLEFHTDLIQQLKTELTARLGAEVLTLCMCAGGLCADCRQEEQNR